ncbi:multi antimicrobial extrusion protein MatE [Cohnella endophytica]|uniref:Multi antimicrobial extrusion protein MatE n=1 Tax=Cohnella endophytica TaxID=2419778 RepID=A0A494Y1H9_9BACL|nr:multi antimicrobial extrusion protein MatE [Cohnella endophytica]RKP54287.1 multi antimicrobial extrusion protein MatE [Cohnella endophytica]
MASNHEPVSLRRLFLFFIPMGISVLLINLSHVIINGTLARSDNQEIILAGYALAMSLLGVTEKPGVLFRQTCSALVRDRISFRAVRQVGFYVFGASLVFGGLVAYTPFGHWIFGGAYGADPIVEREAVHAYYALMFLSVFSGVRCLYQGIIIYKMRTRWLTIAMIFRLGGMFLLSQYFLRVGVDSALQGTIIFVFGMMIEAGISMWEATRLLKKMPEKSVECEVTRPKEVAAFYNPLLYSSLVVVWLLPIMNALLGTTTRGTLAVASFAVAGSLMNLVLGFFTYFHQIALLFVKTNPAIVRRFTLLLGFVPPILMIGLAFTPLGPWMFYHILGVRGELLHACIHALRGFLPFVLLFPWLDTLNGIVMAHGETKLMFASQLANAALTAICIVLLVLFLPGWNGVLGSLAQSCGVLAELSLLAWLFRRRHLSGFTGKL